MSDPTYRIWEPISCPNVVSPAQAILYDGGFGSNGCFPVSVRPASPEIELFTRERWNYRLTAPPSSRWPARGEGSEEPAHKLERVLFEAISRRSPSPSRRQSFFGFPGEPVLALILFVDFGLAENTDCRHFHKKRSRTVSDFTHYLPRRTDPSRISRQARRCAG